MTSLGAFSPLLRMSGFYITHSPLGGISCWQADRCLFVARPEVLQTHQASGVWHQAIPSIRVSIGHAGCPWRGGLPMLIRF